MADWQKAEEQNFEAKIVELSAAFEHHEQQPQQTPTTRTAAAEKEAATAEIELMQQQQHSSAGWCMPFIRITFLLRINFPMLSFLHFGLSKRLSTRTCQHSEATTSRGCGTGHGGRRPNPAHSDPPAVRFLHPFQRRSSGGEPARQPAIPHICMGIYGPSFFQGLFLSPHAFYRELISPEFLTVCMCLLSINIISVDLF